VCSAMSFPCLRVARIGVLDQKMSHADLDLYNRRF
jgi:hypothetical protein